MIEDELTDHVGGGLVDEVPPSTVHDEPPIERQRVGDHELRKCRGHPLCQVLLLAMRKLPEGGGQG